MITLDVIMPGMDGWEVLRALKAAPELEDIPVILMTITNDKNLGYTLGAAEYLTKPVDWDRLGSVLDRMHVGHRGTALVVDDDLSARDLAKRALERAGWQVREAENGRVALDVIALDTPSLIILDLMMPEMDGFALSRHCTSDPTGAKSRSSWSHPWMCRRPTGRVRRRGGTDLAEGRLLDDRPDRGDSPHRDGQDTDDSLMARILLVEDNEMNRDMLRGAWPSAATRSRWPSTARRVSPWPESTSRT